MPLDGSKELGWVIHFRELHTEISYEIFLYFFFPEIFHFEGAQLHLHNLQNIPVRRHCLHFTGAATEAKKKKKG